LTRKGKTIGPRYWGGALVEFRTSGPIRGYPSTCRRRVSRNRIKNPEGLRGKRLAPRTSTAVFSTGRTSLAPGNATRGPALSISPNVDCGGFGGADGRGEGSRI